MTKTWNEIRRRYSPEVEEEICRKVKAKGKMLRHLREARELTQSRLAEALDINRSAVSTMEKRTDIYVSTLRDCIEALGGSLRITAEFADGSVEIDQFGHAADA